MGQAFPQPCRARGTHARRIAGILEHLPASLMNCCVFRSPSNTKFRVLWTSGILSQKSFPDEVHCETVGACSCGGASRRGRHFRSRFNSLPRFSHFSVTFPSLSFPTVVRFRYLEIARLSVLRRLTLTTLAVLQW